MSLNLGIVSECDDRHTRLLQTYNSPAFLYCWFPRTRRVSTVFMIATILLGSNELILMSLLPPSTQRNTTQSPSTTPDRQLAVYFVFRVDTYA